MEVTRSLKALLSHPRHDFTFYLQIFSSTATALDSATRSFCGGNYYYYFAQFSYSYSSNVYTTLLGYANLVHDLLLHKSSSRESSKILSPREMQCFLATR